MYKSNMRSIWISSVAQDHCFTIISKWMKVADGLKMQKRREMSQLRDCLFLQKFSQTNAVDFR